MHKGLVSHLNVNMGLSNTSKYEGVCIFQTKGVVRVQNGAACVIYVLPRRLHALIAGKNKTTLLPSELAMMTEIMA